MNVFYNSNAYLTKRNNIENDKAFKNRLLKIRKIYNRNILHNRISKCI